MNLMEAVEIYWKCDQNRGSPDCCVGCALEKEVRFGLGYLTVTLCSLLYEVELQIADTPSLRRS